MKVEGSWKSIPVNDKSCNSRFEILHQISLSENININTERIRQCPSSQVLGTHAVLNDRLINNHHFVSSTNSTSVTISSRRLGSRITIWPDNDRLRRRRTRMVSVPWQRGDSGCTATPAGRSHQLLGTCCTIAGRAMASRLFTPLIVQRSTLTSSVSPISSSTVKG